MATVLVTGASGFIGSHLVEALLARGDRVRCLVRKTSQVDHLENLGVELIDGDVTDFDAVCRAVEGVDLVFHLVGMINALQYDDQMRVNGLGPAIVARACAQQRQSPVLILASSIAASGPARKQSLRTEADRPAPISNYGRSKRAGELAVAQWADRVPTTVVRPGIVFGERDRLSLPMFTSINRFGIHVIAGFDSPRLSLIYVGDLVETLLRAAESGQRIASVANGNGSASRGYYFACAPEYPNYFQLGQMLAQSLGRRNLLMLPLTEPLPWLVAGLNQLKSRLLGRAEPLNIDKIREATASSWACSSAQSQRELNFSPSQSLQQRLTQTASWYRENGWL